MLVSTFQFLNFKLLVLYVFFFTCWVISCCLLLDKRVALDGMPGDGADMEPPSWPPCGLCPARPLLLYVVWPYVLV